VQRALIPPRELPMIKMWDGNAAMASVLHFGDDMELLTMAVILAVSSALGIAAARLTLSALFYSMARISNRNR
jgi:hypothetical protein